MELIKQIQKEQSQSKQIQLNIQNVLQKTQDFILSLQSFAQLSKAASHSECADTSNILVQFSEQIEHIHVSALKSVQYIIASKAAYDTQIYAQNCVKNMSAQNYYQYAQARQRGLKQSITAMSNFFGQIGAQMQISSENMRSNFDQAAFDQHIIDTLTRNRISDNPRRDLSISHTVQQNAPVQRGSSPVRHSVTIRNVKLSNPNENGQMDETVELSPRKPKIIQPKLEIDNESSFKKFNNVEQTKEDQVSQFLKGNIVQNETQKVTSQVENNVKESQNNNIQKETQNQISPAVNSISAQKQEQNAKEIEKQLSVKYEPLLEIVHKNEFDNDSFQINSKPIERFETAQHNPIANSLQITGVEEDGVKDTIRYELPPVNFKIEQSAISPGVKQNYNQVNNQVNEYKVNNIVDEQEDPQFEKVQIFTLKQAAKPTDFIDNSETTDELQLYPMKPKEQPKQQSQLQKLQVGDSMTDFSINFQTGSAIDVLNDEFKL
ncbi:Hypothetical_protein [Hexamita inflata]|uniref:Hypothetical_protein n=1 Tax=Hexamita inflata TaxID=28002 RepID=A0AA86R4L0_9EUKA|nr:Hypothetical protein HINF_LOCUS49795 [Hexamita inflata]